MEIQKGYRKKLITPRVLPNLNFEKNLTIMNEVQEQSALKKLNTVYVDALSLKDNIKYDGVQLYKLHNK